MPTTKPRIAAYVPIHLKERLSEFQKEKGISESQAIILILVEYFGMTAHIEATTTGAEVGGVTLSRFQSLEKKVADLQEWLPQQQNTTDLKKWAAENS